jgi:hypothetical protein
MLSVNKLVPEAKQLFKHLASWQGRSEDENQGGGVE